MTDLLESERVEEIKGELNTYVDEGDNEPKKSKIPIANSYPDYVLEYININPNIDPNMIKLNYDLIKSMTPEQLQLWNEANDSGDFSKYDETYLKDYKKPELSKETNYDGVEIKQFENYEDAEKWFIENMENNKQ